MSRPRLRTLLVVLLLVVPATVTAAAATQQAKVTIQDVDVDPDPAIVGETVTVAPTIVNQPSSPSEYDLFYVQVSGLSSETASGTKTVRNLGTLTPGASLRVPFDLTFEQAGVHRFRVEVYGEDETGENIRLEYPVTVKVRDEHPDVSIRTDATLTTGFDERVNVTVSNGFDREIRSVDVQLSGDQLSVRQVSDGAPRIEAGSAERFAFDVRTDQAGRWTVTATVTYRTSTGLERTVTESRSLRFEPLREDVTLDAAEPPEGSFAIPVTVGNFGNAPLESVVVRGEATNGSISPVAVGTVPAGTTRRVLVNVSGVETRADVTLRATYELGDRQGTVSADSRVVATEDVPGEIELTGLNVEAEGGVLHVTGSASNVGLQRVDSVVVRVRDTEQVSGAAPNREYFVGTVPASDFVSFDVYATTEGDVSEIPLTVTYLSDGDRRTLETSVPYDGDASQEPEPNANSSPSLLVYLLGGVAALLVVAVVVMGWRNRAR